MKNQNQRIMDEKEEYYSLVKKVFKILAPFYNTVTMPISKIRDKVVNYTNAKNGSRILDVGTGTGKQAFAFAKRGYDVTGIDLSEDMLKVAVKKNKYENVEFINADAANLPFKDSSFDVSSVSFALHDMLLSIREEAVKEMVRVTKQEGMVVIIDYALPENRIRRFLIYHFIKLYEGKYYIEFIKSEFEALLRKSGIDITEKLPILIGAGRILKGIKMSDA
ncbi:MAG: methyltransferase domain-containing protein [Nitrospinae bacterium]|nr:methyltransferase domain-containing protein [Nitrospinota bacterium]